MALTPLATAADLDAANVDTSDDVLTEAALAAATDAVRAAAGGVTISRHAGTVDAPGSPEPYLPVPGWAVSDVTDVQINGQPVTGWIFQRSTGRLYRAAGWQPGHEPVDVTMTVTQGLTQVPADIVDLVVALAAAAMNDAREGSYGSARGLAYERIDDYQQGFRQGDAEIISPVELPERTRQMLAERFGAAAYVTGSY